MAPGPHLTALIDLALAEDIGPGDLTTEALFAPRAQSVGAFIARESMVVSGMDTAAAVFQRIDGRCRFRIIKGDGSQVRKGARLATIKGPTRALLTGERTALNFVRRMCGIASLTRRYVQALEGTACTLLDTRKTTPGYRVLEKAAVRAGGGRNHRLGLFDGVMIKDNHIQAKGSIAKAVAAARKRIPPTVKIEVECDTLRQVQAAVRAGADIIMLDNMSPARMRKAVAAVAGRALTEASGRLELDTIRAAALAGVDYVSVGALTHSAHSADVAMDMD